MPKQPASTAIVVACRATRRRGRHRSSRRSTSARARRDVDVVEARDRARGSPPPVGEVGGAPERVRGRLGERERRDRRRAVVAAAARRRRRPGRGSTTTTGLSLGGRGDGGRDRDGDVVVLASTSGGTKIDEHRVDAGVGEHDADRALVLVGATRSATRSTGLRTAAPGRSERAQPLPASPRSARAPRARRPRTRRRRGCPGPPALPTIATRRPGGERLVREHAARCRAAPRACRPG